MSHFHSKLQTGFAHKTWIVGRNTKNSDPQISLCNTAVRVYLRCLWGCTEPEEGIWKGTKLEHNPSSFGLIQFIREIRSGVSFNMFSLGSHRNPWLQLGWLTCVAASCAASSVFWFHLSRQGFWLPHSGRQCEISYLDLISLCWVSSRENTCSLTAWIQWELQTCSTAEDSDLCPWLASSGAVLLQYPSGFQHFWTVDLQWGLGSFQAGCCRPPLLYLLVSVEHELKTSALIYQEIHFKTPDSLHIIFPLAHSCQRRQLW